MHCKEPRGGFATGAAGQALVYTLPQFARQICYLVAGRFCQLASLNEHRLCEWTTAPRRYAAVVWAMFGTALACSGPSVGKSIMTASGSAPPAPVPILIASRSHPLLNEAPPQCMPPGATPVCIACRTDRSSSSHLGSSQRASASSAAASDHPLRQKLL